MRTRKMKKKKGLPRMHTQHYYLLDEYLLHYPSFTHSFIIFTAVEK